MYCMYSVDMEDKGHRTTFCMDVPIIDRKRVKATVVCPNRMYIV